jgi:hypothetical protein
MFMFDGGKGAEFEAGDVGEDGGAAGGDAVLDQQGREFREEVVDMGGGAEVGGLVAEGGAEVGIDDDLGIGLGGLAGTEGGIWIEGEKAAARTVDELVVAAVVGAGICMNQDRGVAVGVSGLVGHLVSFWRFLTDFRGSTPPGICKSIDRKGLLIGAFGSAGTQRRFTAEVTEFREIGKEPEESTGTGNVELAESLNREAGYYHL